MKDRKASFSLSGIGGGQRSSLLQRRWKTPEDKRERTFNRSCEQHRQQASDPVLDLNLAHLTSY